MLYRTLSSLLPTRPCDITPQRIVFIRPCCIGDVVMASGALSALRETFPETHITWAVGTWSARAIEHHPAIDAILDTGQADLPVRSINGLSRFVKQLRDGKFDLVISLVRSPLMSLAVLLAGIPYRAGLDSLGRGFGYNIRVPIDPTTPQHEGEIYLKVIGALADKPLHAYANLPVLASAQASIQQKLASLGVGQPYIVVHPGGGSNPGMQMDSKRYPPDQLAKILNRIADQLSTQVILIGGPNDSGLIQAVDDKLSADAITFVGDLSFAEIGALAKSALCYIGNDTGMTHIAAASGAPSVMMMGPSDPRRYAPFTEHHLTLWKPTDLNSGGVANADKRWDWSRDGFTVNYAVEKILEFVQ